MRVPFALLSAVLVLESRDELEIGITEIDEQGLVFRMAEPPGPVLCMQLFFDRDRTGAFVCDAGKGMSGAPCGDGCFIYEEREHD